MCAAICVVLVVFLHQRYRTLGGEERAVEDLAWLVRTELGEDVEVLTRDSGQLGGMDAARALLRGGADPEEVGDAVRRTGARVVHAHNLNPTFGWRALKAARDAGARTVLHLHNYRLVCAVGTCFNSRGEDCTRCHGRDTLPGVRLNCRGSYQEAIPYAIALARHQRRLVAQADAVVVPSDAALDRLRQLGAPLAETDEVHVVPHVIRDFAAASQAQDGTYALVAGRLAPEKRLDDVIAAAATADIPLVIAGDGPEEQRLKALAGDTVTFTGRVDRSTLDELRSHAAVEVIASRAAETFGLAAVEAMAQGLPVVATKVGALQDLAPEAELVTPGDRTALAQAIARTAGDRQRGDACLARARRLSSPAAVAQQLGRIYG